MTDPLSSEAASAQLVLTAQVVHQLGIDDGFAGVSRRYPHRTIGLYDEMHAEDLVACYDVGYAKGRGRKCRQNYVLKQFS